MVRFDRVVALIAPIFALWLVVPSAFAIETAPRISDREIIEGLAELKAGQKILEGKINGLQRQIDDSQESTNKQFDAVNKRFDTLERMFDRFISIALALLGIAFSLLGVIGKILWNQQKRMLAIETSLETQRDELAFLKKLVESLLPSRGVV